MNRIVMQSERPTRGVSDDGRGAGASIGVLITGELRRPYRFRWISDQHRDAEFHQQSFETSFNAALYQLQESNYPAALPHLFETLQNFYQFYLRAAAYQDGIARDRFNTGWNILSRDPEQQLEAYVLFYVEATGRTPDQLTDLHLAVGSAVEDDCVGVTREDILSLAQETLDVLCSALTEALRSYPAGIQRIAEESLNG